MGRAARIPHGPGKRLSTDARFRAELELCEKYRIPHSQFRGIGDGTWTARDRHKALAYRDYQRATCGQCGTRESDWVDDDGDFVEAYVASTHKCFGCAEIARKQSEIPDGKAGAGMKVLLIPPAIHAALLFQKEQARLADRTTT